MGLYPMATNPLELGLPVGPHSKVFYVDPQHGDNDNTGRSPLKPLLTVQAALDRCVTNHNDVVAFIGGPTADEPTEAIAWDLDYTHLVGLSSDVYGLGQRCRVVATAANDIETAPIVFSGSGCIVRNMQFNNEHASGTATGCGIVTGSRNFFENCFFMAPTSVTAAAYSLKLGGSENVFLRCTMGQYTNARTGATRALWVYGPTVVQRNKFVKCEFLSWSTNVTTTHVCVFIDSGITVTPMMLEFEDCLFANFPEGGAAGGLLAQAIDDDMAAWHQILLRGKNDFAGCSAVADTLTHIFNAEQGTAASGLLMVAVSES